MSEPIFVVSCDEPGGQVDRSVYPFVLTPENGMKFWECARQFPKIFNNIATDSPNEFLDSFFSFNPTTLEGRAEALIWVVDDFLGVFSLTNIYYPDDALMHFTFFDKRLRGRESLIREMITYVFDTYDFNRLSAEIPAYTSKVVFKFISDKIGLALEGRKRKSIKYKNDLCDVILYGITKDEVNSWERQRLRQ